MIKHRFVTLLCIVLIACNAGGEKKTRTTKAPAVNATPYIEYDPDTTAIAGTADTVTRKLVTDQVVDIEPRLIRIERAAFYKYKAEYTTPCNFDPTGVVKGLNWKLESDCKEICVQHLVNIKTGEKNELMVDFDQGIIGLLISPSCGRLFTYASYDGSDYDKFYDFRAVVTCYKIGRSGKLKDLQYLRAYCSKKWSIDDMTWIDNQSVALKMYSGWRSCNSTYRYFKARIY